jgi:hypothetical protein
MGLHQLHDIIQCLFVWLVGLQTIALGEILGRLPKTTHTIWIVIAMPAHASVNNKVAVRQAIALGGVPRTFTILRHIVDFKESWISLGRINGALRGDRQKKKPIRSDMLVFNISGKPIIYMKP